MANVDEPRNLMSRYYLIFLLAGSTTALCAQPYEISMGLFSGITSTYTWDEGIFNDPRYKSRYDVKVAPIGINYGVDFATFGFVITPGIINIGQNHHIVNAVGGHEGTRRMNLRYATLPFALKAHVIDLAFFRVSLAGGGGVGFLLDGKETVTHNYAKYRFPQETYPILPSTYVVEYDGVIAPETSELAVLARDDFKRFQVFASAGFRSDWDLSENWRVSLDVRANYAFFDSRTDEYISRVEAYESIYDMPGKRRDIFATLNIGISRYIEIDEKKLAPDKRSRKFSPQKNAFHEKRKRKRKRN